MASKIEAPASYIIASLYPDAKTHPKAGASTVDVLNLEDVTRAPNLDELVHADAMRKHSLFEVARRNGSISKVFLITDEDTIKAAAVSGHSCINTTLVSSGRPYPARLYINAVVLAWDTRELDPNYSRNAA